MSSIKKIDVSALNRMKIIAYTESQVVIQVLHAQIKG